MKKNILALLISIFTFLVLYIFVCYDPKGNFDTKEIKQKLSLPECLSLQIIDEKVYSYETDYTKEYIFRITGKCTLILEEQNYPTGNWKYSGGVWFFEANKKNIESGEYYEAFYIKKFGILFVTFSHL